MNQDKELKPTKEAGPYDALIGCLILIIMGLIFGLLVVSMGTCNCKSASLTPQPDQVNSPTSQRDSKPVQPDTQSDDIPQPQTELQTEEKVSTSAEQPEAKSSADSTTGNFAVHRKNYEAQTFNLKRSKAQAMMLLSQLMQFKDKSDFHEYGFGAGGPYHQWLEDVETMLKKTPRKPEYIAFSIALSEMRQIGLDFMKTRGQPNQYIKDTLPGVFEAFK